ncbi:hypothetical protein RclHR1_03130016 [Rhizophagus clarus]|uniref:S8 family serine peptidase n=2 Tax=Rhizophagus clarus TaxID=94130 RepID=A0A2Z6R7B5_9GLOM|nr:hypothetical protein RclHR1_03130016 [Rhizophagus clarus]GES81826.1 S8 family serine peptidase [Rhizophagus clarus]
MNILNKIIIYFFLLCYIFSTALGDAPISVLPDDTNALDKVYIIRYSQALSPKIVLDRIRDAGINYTHRFNLEIIDSISLKLNENDDVIRCSKISGIEHIWPVRKFKPRLFTAHKISGVDVFRQRTGFDGTGIKVGIIDNGLDYTHPAFGNCFKTPGCKTQFGFDLVGNGTSDNPMPDDDPLETCEGHGTHVAGIVAADDHELNFTGVAPGVTLGIYRAIDCNSNTVDDLLIQGLQLAKKDNMDIINLSLGGNFRGWNDTPLGIAVNKLADEGFVIVVAASNLGDEGLFTSGDPDSSANIISVGDVDNIQYLSFVLVPSSDPKKEILYNTDHLSLRYRLPGPLPIVIANTTANLPENDGCNSYNTDFTNKIALIRRGGCDFNTKISNAVAAGAIGVVFYNDVDTLIRAIPLNETPDAIISDVDGEYLKQQIRENENLTVTFPDKMVAIPLTNAGKPSSESSWGPTFEFDIKPDLLAPGGRIFSTFPINLGKYATIDGTSMAAAYTSGTIALYMQANGLRRGNFDPLKLRDLLVYTATPIHNTTKFPFSVDKQGGGLLNINEAIKTKAVIQPSKLLLNDSAHFKGTHQITITNTGNMTTKYTFNHIPTPSIRGWFNNTWVNTDSFVIQNHFAGVKLSKHSVLVRPGKTARITVKFTQPTNMPNDFGIYSGYISIKDSAQRTTSTIPYLGVKGDIHKIPILSNNPPPDILRPSDGVVIVKPNQIGQFTFTGDDFPVFEFTLNYGTRFLIMELFKSGDFTTSGFVGIPIFQTGFSNPSFQFPRNGPATPVAQKPWSSRLVSDINGGNVTVPDGQYQLLLKILRPFGNPNNRNDFVTWKSPIIEIIDPSNTSVSNQTTTQTTTKTGVSTKNQWRG